MLAAAACCCCVSMVSMSFRLKAGRNASSFELAAASALASSSTSADTSSLVGCRPPLSPGEDGTRSSSPSSLILLPSTGAFLSSVLSASVSSLPSLGGVVDSVADDAVALDLRIGNVLLLLLLLDVTAMM